MTQNSIPGLDFGLGSDLDMLRDTVRAFSQNKIAPLAAEIDRANTFPRELWPQLGELGLLGITVEEELGRLRPRLSRALRGDGGDFRGRPPRSACPTARIPISASTRSAATAVTSSASAICRS